MWLKRLRPYLIGFVVFMVVGNLAIVSAWAWANATSPALGTPQVPGIDNLEVVDAHLWRGAAPSRTGYRGLAAHGVETIIDLRAEDNLHVDRAQLKKLGLRLVRIPLRDGQAPSAAQVNRFLRATKKTEGRVFVHCGAGVGRTGTMAAAYLVSHEGTSALEALKRNLSVGPPSLEQITFVAELGGNDFERPSPVVTAVSRVLDAPRRIWTGLSS